MRFLKSIALPAFLALIIFLAGIRTGAAFQRMQGQELFGGDTTDDGSGSGTVVTDPEREVDISLLWSVWRLLQRYYVDPGALQTSALVDGAIGGMVSGIGDPFTAYMPPKENKAFRQSLEGRLQGIGAELTLKDGAVTVVSPLKGSPAERAGLLPGDVIAKVNNESITGMSLNDVVDRVRGKKGTTVVLQVYRADEPEPLTFSIVREDISVPSVESKILTSGGKKIGYIALNQFGENSTAEVRKALQSFQGQGIAGIILDLRWNGGGYLDGATDIVSMFLRSGEVVAVEGRGGVTERHDVTGNPLFPDTPMVVLINQASASASEIVAGALQDHKRATIVGKQSFGKGTVQEVLDLPNGGSLRVTTAHWLTPNGKNLGKEGVHPDVEVERGKNDAPGKSDAQLEKAEEVVVGKK